MADVIDLLDSDDDCASVRGPDGDECAGPEHEVAAPSRTSLPVGESNATRAKSRRREEQSIQPSPVAVVGTPDKTVSNVTARCVGKRRSAGESARPPEDVVPNTQSRNNRSDPVDLSSPGDPPSVIQLDDDVQVLGGNVTSSSGSQARRRGGMHSSGNADEALIEPRQRLALSLGHLTTSEASAAFREERRQLWGTDDGFPDPEQNGRGNGERGVRNARGEGEGNAPKRRRVNSTERSERVRLREEDRLKRAAERAAAKEAKEQEKIARHRDQIMQRFAEFEAGTEESAQHTVCVVVPDEMTKDRHGRDLHARLHAVFPGQVVVRHGVPVVNAVQWKRRRPGEVLSEAPPGAVVPDDGGDTVEFVCLCYKAESIVDMMQTGVLESVALDIVKKLSGKRIELVIEGAKQVCSAAASAAVRGAGDEHAQLPSLELLHDCCMSLYMEYNITSVHVRNHEELCDHLISVTHRIAYAPYRKPLTCTDMNSNLTPGDVSGRVTGVDADGEVRVESDDDPGLQYLKWLTVIPGVSLEKAKCIRMTYPTLQSLFTAYDLCETEDARNVMLADLRTSNGRRLGPAVSKHVSFVFNCRDGNAVFDKGAS